MPTSLAGMPDNADGYLNLGLALTREGRHEEAAAAFRRAAAIDSGNPGLHLNLGNALAAQGKAEEALACFRKALALKPDHAGVLFNLGTQLRRMGRLDESEAAFQAAIATAPDYADAHHNLGVLYQEQKRLDAAAARYRRTLELEPGHYQAASNLGSVLRAWKKPDEAAALHEKLLAAHPDRPDAYVNLGHARLDQGRYEEAQALYERAIELNPASAATRFDVGNSLSGRHLWDEAIAQYARALEIKPGLDDAQYNLGLARLFRGDFGQGWPGYERRLQSADVRAGIRKGTAALVSYERLPRWQGPAEAGVREVGIWAEQGIGDQLLMSTLIPELIGAAMPFIYEVDPRLLKAYERSFPGQRFVPLKKTPHVDLLLASRVLLAGSLPGLFRGLREDFVRQPRALLHARPERVAHYRGRLDELGPGLKVAFSWKSKRKTHIGPEKSAPLREFAPLLKRPGAHFVDVQYGDTAAERRAVQEATGVPLQHFDQVDYFNDLEEVLAILEACDLVITTSNAIAHFSGALGKRAWLLYLAENPPFHYWSHGGSYRSLWYPAVEIVTARQFTEWAPLIKHVAERLAQERS